MDPSTLKGTSTHIILMRIRDLCGLLTDYSFTVDVFNTAPKFTPVGFAVRNVEITMNSVIEIDLNPNINDIDDDPIQIALAQMINSSPIAAPAMFSVISPGIINIKPTTFADVGSYKIRVEIYDYPTYSSFIYFDVKVTNTAPVFLKNQAMKN